MSDNLWPTDFGVLTAKTPVSILREQAQALGDRTDSIVVGRVLMGHQPPVNKFRHLFNLFCAPLGYQMTLFMVDHDIALYPAEIFADGWAERLLAATPEEFTEKLREIFSRESTKKIIASLIAQSTA